MENAALIFNMQRYSLHDGPGIRTLVFFKGCALRCKWCSNPEGISPLVEIKYKKQLCNGCGHCLSCPKGAVSAAPDKGFVIDRSKCVVCGHCASVCPTKAKEICGEELSAEHIYQKVKRDAAFYESSGGGITLGGGDPLFQPKPAIELLRICRENGLNTAIETTGNYDFEVLCEAALHCDTILYDIKGWNSERHKENTAVGNQLILKNLLALGEWVDRSSHKPAIVVRIPLLPGFNFSLHEFTELAGWLSTVHNLQQAEILPLHHLGSNKYEQIGREYFFGSDNLTAVRSESVKDYVDILRNNGVNAIVRDS